MQNGYNLWGFHERYRGIIFVIIVLVIRFPGRCIISIIFIIFHLIYLWFHPIVKIENDGLLITRWDIFKCKLKWDEVRLIKRNRWYAPIYPRYAIIKDKYDSYSFMIVHSHFKEYDEFIEEIEMNLPEENISGRS